jgi:toxin ParE1/3/4
MTWKLIVRPEAEIDIAEAFEWYERQRKGLGIDFLLRVESTFDSLTQDPFAYTPIYKEIRRKLIRRFPYGVFYMINSDTIIVLAVIHAKRHPLSWKSRQINSQF